MKSTGNDGIALKTRPASVWEEHGFLKNEVCSLLYTDCADETELFPSVHGTLRSRVVRVFRVQTGDRVKLSSENHLGGAPLSDCFEPVSCV